MTPDTFVASGATALGLALLMLFLFVHGDIVPGEIYRKQVDIGEALRQTIERLAAAMEIRNRVDEKLLDRDERRDRRRDDSR